MASDTVLSRPASKTRAASSKIACRPIDAEDLPAVIDLLHKGFPRRNRRYWEAGLQRLARHVPPPGFPRFGDMLTTEGRPRRPAPADRRPVPRSRGAGSVQRFKLVCR